MTTPLFSDEVQLAGWSDSHTSGAKVTFWLSDPTLLDAFRGMTERKGKTAGQRLAMVLVEISDQETLVEQPEAPKEPIGELCRLAVMWCKDEAFQQWIADVAGPGIGLCEQDAKNELYAMCGIQSRKELDTDAEAVNKFHRLIRIPFMKYLKGLE